MNKKNLKSLLQNKQKIISRETGYPSQSSGRDGDFQVRRIPGQGIFLFYKWYNKWYSSRLTQYRPRTAEHKEPVKLPIGVKPIKEGDLSIDNGIVSVGKSGNKSNKIISVDKDNLADITTPAYFKRTDTTDMADDEAKDPTFLIENTGHAHLRFYSPSNVYDQFISFGRRHPETFTTASWCIGLDSSANKFRIMYKGISGGSSSNHTKVSELTPSSGDSYENLSMNSAGNIWLGLVQNPGSDTDKFLVIDNSNNGLVGFRTGAEVLADIGGQASGNYITGTGSLSAGDLTNIGNLSGTNTGDQTLPTNYLRDDASDSTTGTITAAGFTTTGTWTFDDATSGTVGITTIHTGSSFTDNDTSLMTAGAIKEKIEAYGYTTADGDITSVRFVTDSGSGAAAEDTADTANFSLLGANGVGVTNSGTTITAEAVPSEIDHDSLDNFVSNEHIDWTSASAGTIHATNYTNTTYSVMASGNSYAAGLVAAGSGTHSNQFLRKDGTWVVPTDTDTNTNQLTTFTVSATTDSNATTISQGDDLMFAAGTGITCETTADGTVTITNTVSAPTNYVTNDADDTMAGALTIDKNSIATTSSTTRALYLDYDHTGATGSGQSINNVGMDVNVNCSSVTHVGSHTSYGIKGSVTSSTTGTGTAYGMSMGVTGGDTNIGIITNVTDGGIDFKAKSTANASDYFTMATGTNGATTLTTVDDDDALAHLTLDPDGDLLISGADVMIDAGKKLYLDGDGHTYFTESSDDVLDLFIGGTQIYRISELGANTFFEMMAGGGFSVPFQAPLYLDGGANTYIKSNTADQISLHCGAATVFTIAEDGATNGDYASFGTTSAGFTQFEPTYNATDTYVYFNRAGNKAHLTFGAGSTAIVDIHMHFPPVSGNFTLLIKQHASGGGSVTNWKTFDKAGSNESTVVWPAATAPTLTTGSNKIDIISLYWDADNNKAYGVASLNF